MTAWTRLVRAHIVTGRELGAELLSEHGLTVNGYEALYLLSQAEGGRMKRVDLAEQLLLTPSGVTRMLEGLEREGLVERVACDTDLRVSYAALTDAGWEKLAAASCGHQGSVKSILEKHLNEDEIKQLAELLGKLPGGAGDEPCAAT